MTPSSDGRPLVSICIPTYNRAGMVGDAIRSALAQTFTDIEVLVVDNASADDTAAVVASFTDPRLRYVRNDRNLGLFGNFNRCIELAQGKYLHILHSDDTIPPEFTATCATFLEGNPRVGMTFTGAEVEAGGAVATMDYTGSSEVYAPPEGFRRILRDRNVVICPSVMARREILLRHGGFPPEYPYASDLALWLRIGREEPVAFVHGTRIRYRQGSHSESHRLLFASATGYLDLLRIFLTTSEELGPEKERFQPELNAALERHAGDCLHAACFRGGAGAGTSPSFLASVGRSALALTVGGPLRSRPWRFCLGLLLITAPLLCRLPGFRSVMGVILGPRASFY